MRFTDFGIVEFAGDTLASHFLAEVCMNVFLFATGTERTEGKEKHGVGPHAANNAFALQTNVVGMRVRQRCSQRDEGYRFALSGHRMTLILGRAGLFKWL